MLRAHALWAAYAGHRHAAGSSNQYRTLWHNQPSRRAPLSFADYFCRCGYPCLISQLRCILLKHLHICNIKGGMKRHFPIALPYLVRHHIQLCHNMRGASLLTDNGPIGSCATRASCSTCTAVVSRRSLQCLLARIPLLLACMAQSVRHCSSPSLLKYRFRVGR